MFNNRIVILALFIGFVGGCSQQQGTQAPPDTFLPQTNVHSLVSGFGPEAQDISGTVVKRGTGPENTETLEQVEKDLGISLAAATEANAATHPTEKALRAFGLGRAAWLSGDDAEAQTFLEQARKEDPQSATVLELLAQVYADENRDDAAYECLIASEKIAPYSLQSNLMLGQYAYRRHDWPTTILYILRAENSPELQADSPLEPMINFYLAIALQNAGYHLAASDRFAACAELISIPWPAFRMNQQVSNLMDHKNVIELLAGENAYAAGNYSIALKYYRLSKMDGLINVAVLARIVEIEALQQDFNAAEQDAVELAYSDGVLPQTTGLIDWVWKQAGRGYWIRDDLAQMGQTSSPALFVLGMMEEELGDWQDSYTNLSRYLEDYPDDQRVLAPLAALARQEQQIPQAYLLFAWAGSQGKISSDIISSNFLAMTGENPSAELISDLSAVRQAQSGSSGSGLPACWQFYLLGMAAGEGDQPVAAVGFLRQAVDADPSFWPARQLLIRHLEELNQFQEAENVVRDQKDQSADAAAEAELVRLYIAEDRLELAAQTAESGIKKYPDNSDCYFLAADIYDVQRDNERESYALARLVSRFPDLQDGYKRLLVFAADNQNEQLQNAVIGRYIAEFPNDSFSGILSARLKAQQGDYSGAERILRQSLASHPGDESIYLALAGLQSAQGNQAATLEILQDAVIVDVDSVNLFTALAQTLESMKQPDEAVAIFAASAIRHPDSEGWQTAYASLLSGLDRNSEVESLINKLQKQEPQQHWVQILYEQYLEQTGQWAQAKQVLEQLCVGPYPQLTDLYDLAQVDLMLGDTASETSIYQRILKLSPYDADANNNLGYEWTLEDHNLQEAKRMISIAVENYPNESAYHDSLGWVLFKLNDPREALDELRMAVGLPGGQNPEGMEHLGDVLDALGEKSEAIESWKTGLQLLASQGQLSPDDLKTQKNLQDRIKKAAPWIKLDELKPENAM